MTWVKLDDQFSDHPKVKALSDPAYRAFVDGLCFCSRYLTDGRIPAANIRAIAKTRAVSELVSAGMWERNGDGVLVHDYLDFQPSAKRIRAKRASDSRRIRNRDGEDS